MTSIFDLKSKIEIAYQCLRSKVNPLDYFKLKSTRLFHPHYYLGHYYDLVLAQAEPILHFLAHGGNENRIPHPLFDTGFAKVQLRSLGIFGNPLIGYLSNRNYEKVWPNILFDPQFMKAHYGISHLSEYLSRKDLWDKPTNAFWDHTRSILFNKQDWKIVNPLIHVFENHRSHALSFYKVALKRQSDLAFARGDLPTLRKILSITSYLEGVLTQDLTNLEIHSWQSLMDFSASRKCFFIEPGESRRLQIRRPPVFAGQPFDLPEGSIELKPLYISKVAGIKLIGGSRYLIGPENQILHDESAFHFDGKYTPKFRGTALARDGKVAIFTKTFPAIPQKTGILICCEHDNNFFHWSVEALSQVLLAEENRIPLNIPLIIPAGLHPNLLRLLSLVKSPDRPVIEIQIGQIYEFEELYVPSNPHQLLDKYKGRMEIEDCVIDPVFVRKIRDAFHQRLNVHPEHKLNLVLFRKATQARKLINAGDYNAFFKSHGFQEIEIEKLSTDEQIKTFSQTRFLVALSGAALTNLIFSAPKTRVLVLNSLHPNANLLVFGQLAASLDLTVAFALGPIAHNLDGKYSVHQDFFFDLKASREALQWLEKESPQETMSL